MTDLIFAGLSSHAKLEEELLFKALEGLADSEAALAELRQEHDQIEAKLLGLLEGLSTLKRMGHARSRLLLVVKLARQHFAKEEREIFPFAERRLDQGTLVNLGDRWAEQRGVS
jgi:hemerythrin-like domain-containing protein